MAGWNKNLCAMIGISNGLCQVASGKMETGIQNSNALKDGRPFINAETHH
jgi:hypothetical protein